MTGFFELFQPGLLFKREQEDLESTLVVEADKGGSGPQPLDLDSGSVLLKMPPQPHPPGQDAEPATGSPDPGSDQPVG